ncbi:MAG TPA: hypothetical protein VHD56_09525 [Tepidisphaeraceae bacterium]|nr:hypothetical protein [Tepidisphaeraceae bacterium]
MLLPTWGCAQSAPITLRVDASDVSRKILHAQLRIPAQNGKMTLLYPKWIPGEHGPTGPVTDLAGLKIYAAGKSIQWQRDPEEMFAFHFDVPAGADAIDVTLDFILPSGGGAFSSGVSSTSQLLDINWNQLLLYPQGAKASEIIYSTTLRLPQGWKYGTALPVSKESDGAIDFAPASLETLVDSPLICGTHFRRIELAPGVQPPHFLDIVADGTEALEIKPEDVDRFSNLVNQTGLLFGARHYRDYHFLLTLSDHVDHFGLEHHESSDDRVDENFLTDETARMLDGGLLPHEMVHSWNGKFRRPADIATPDYQQPMKTELLWVYEGLTQYLGEVLTARSGLCSEEQFRDSLAVEAARLNDEPGRTWRPLADTAVAAQLLYFAPRSGSAWRRSVDFYSEGLLIWLEADVVIRQQTAGKRSLDDFCRKFHGQENSPPRVSPFVLDDVIAALNEVAPYDWRSFFKSRISEVTTHAPLGGIDNGGWKLTFQESPTETHKSMQSTYKFTELRFSLGFNVGNEGNISDVVPNSPAAKAGLAPNMKLIAVNGRKYSSDGLKSAIKLAKTNPAPIELLVENEDYYKTFQIDYHGGEKYPVLTRDDSKTDLLTEIIKPLSK